ncbi:MAG: GTP 3',8-cyclase MoaA [Gammaproteobacteria bacterium]|nr:GTP 3',8-cyclase MoaA [Gammaproteobacteria bacterium]NIR98608.1 GTP 3',8-cyclase MoaA [Gammaproteobacteria bacterium]NIT64331.1 GTP 3',8-cyclase MoaA [Gammaproteobacteria bacterium]NIV21255.1 GTP 3',8-cyclase MoaA [Gammaproteobacteria bacterium]NIX10959.1 GTP 3',8-cyclase MoaA [Gammaproteobacteria bacterium]
MTDALVDPFGRSIEYVRLSVTDHCDLRCFYCMPKGFKGFEVPEHWLSFGEIERVIRAFSELGTRRVRLTGGEPLLRNELPALVSRLHALRGVEDLSLSTNAVRLARHARALRDAGVCRINVSLDSLRAERFRAISGGKLEKVLDGLMAAKAAGFAPVKINMVVMRGVNDDEVEALVEFCIDHGFTLRLIETMPMGDTGRAASERYVDLQVIERRLAQRYELLPGVMPGGGPARYVRVGGTELRIGFITPISQHFCETCNRVRLTVDGTLYMCLGREHRYELRPILRGGASHDELQQHIRSAIALKPARHEFRGRPQQVVRFMSQTGG